MNEDTMKKEIERGLCGSQYGRNAVAAWNFTDGLDILVTARRLPGDSLWRVAGKSFGELVYTGTAIGGVGRTILIVKALRDALTARRMRKRTRAANRRERKEVR